MRRRFSHRERRRRDRRRRRGTEPRRHVGTKAMGAGAGLRPAPTEGGDAGSPHHSSFITHPPAPVASTRYAAGEAPESAGAIKFVHPSEEEFARILDFYRIDWVYEPRSFPLRWEGDRVMEMFTPDFYLPDLDLYVELTTMKQSLVTRKNRKLRELRALYPDVNVRLLYRRDYQSLLGKYGYRALTPTTLGDIERVLLSSAQIQRRVRQLAKQISRDYAGEELRVIGILKGVAFFITDLARLITVPVSIDYMFITKYSRDGSESGSVRIVKDLDLPIQDKHVLLVEDIVDTGFTLRYILNYLRKRNPASLRVCTLLDKRARRLVDEPLDYVAFEVPDEFVVGYGLDHRELYRNLPYICVLKPEADRE
jgi:hypoxanthine phosphoribosyltransferase